MHDVHIMDRFAYGHSISTEMVTLNGVGLMPFFCVIYLTEFGGLGANYVTAIVLLSILFALKSSLGNIPYDLW